MMSLQLVDALSYLLYGLKYLAIVLATLILIFGLDDLFIDIVYWGRRLFRQLRIYDSHQRADEKRLFETPEKPLAIMVPAWQEVGVVGEMARLAASTLDYENYQIFIGTYPNDPETMADVDAVCLNYPNVHKVVCARPGPTSKADCLNNVIDAIQRFESAAQVKFSGFILHDAEDVISPLELRLFNYLLPRKDMIQIPVYPYAPPLSNFTAGHYCDEFAENHGKDVVVREALTGQVPSAGVGTCFSRQAIMSLLDDGDGIAFDVQSLTEDYDVGFRLNQKGMHCIFVRYSVTDPKLALASNHKKGISKRFTQVICVREHFPRILQQAIRQKSRWITGIVYQGTSSLGWSPKLMLSYFLWRDRRGMLAYTLGFIVNLLLIIMLSLWLLTLIYPEAWRFPSILSGGSLLGILLWLNGFLLLNRLLQRAYFVTRFYGLVQGLISGPRMVWSNVINFFANLRALRQVVQMGNSHRVAWDKTTHDFPAFGLVQRKPLGQCLIEQGLISESDLHAALASPARKQLGRELLLRGLINSHQLVKALALQLNAPWAPLNPFTLQPGLIATLPRTLALHHAVLPVAEDGRCLVLASERPVSQVAIGAIQRQIGRPVRWQLAQQGRVTLGLRHWYVGDRCNEATRQLLQALKVNATDEALLEKVCMHQVLFGDLLQTRGLIPAAVFYQALMDFDSERQSLGQHLLDKGMLTEQALQSALSEHSAEQQACLRLLGEHK